MDKWLLRIGGTCIALILVGFAAWIATHTSSLTILNPAGLIATKERQLMAAALGLMLIVVVPVFVLIFSIAWKYRASNTKARYTPDWDSNRGLEALWWGVPLVVMGALGVIIWTSSHELDPTKAIASNTPPLKVQVVALQWKWLFLYPEQGVASANMLKIPTGRPVQFEITSDAPMNSFWIPQLGGQIYAMSGMSTHLSLQADRPGAYRGSSANISGEGFADMNFMTSAVDQAEFDEWVSQTRTTSGPMDAYAYSQLAQPAILKTPMTYAPVKSGLYDEVVMKYMMP